MTQPDPIIVVEINNERIVLVGTPESFVIQSDNKEYVKTAKNNMQHVRKVPLIQGMPYKLFPTGDSTYLELTAAIVAVNPGDAIILQAPEEVLAALQTFRGQDSETTVF